MARQGLTTAFPIQQATLPDTLAGRDVLGRGRTGSGKSLAFLLPLVARLAASETVRTSRRPRGLVVVPTRELANQLRAAIAALTDAAGLRVAVVYGGVRQHSQAAALRSGVDVVIACPGRLEDLIAQGLCDLSRVEITVLDEADHMADLGFLPAVRRLLDQTPRYGQRMLFSATLDNGVDVLVRRYLDTPVTHAVDSVASAPAAMTHHVLHVTANDKAAVVRELASGLGRSLLFTRTKHMARRLARQLSAAGIPSVDLHGDLAQNKREQNLSAFRSGDVRVLVATDIAARGIHVEDIELVVHVDPPAEHKAYLHRSGRTARAGGDGSVITVVTPEQRSGVNDLVRRARIRPTSLSVRPGDTAVRDLVGEPAPLRQPSATPAVDRPRRAGSRPPQRSQRRGTAPARRHVA
ncbi:MAG: DEAD/DEAH box helicase [Actinomycetota bacterium]|nr:DEAD/DEAH box helicase [Actinomycetota bacterium]